MPGESADDQGPIHLSAQEARGGEIELTTRWRRAVFIAGLVGIIVLVAVLSFWH